LLSENKTNEELQCVVVKKMILFAEKWCFSHGIVNSKKTILIINVTVGRY
jgi:hypothetical protein